MAFSDNPTQFNKDLLDALKQAQLDLAASGGIKKIRKGDFYAEYRSDAELQKSIDRLENVIWFQENPCKRRCDV